MAYSHTFEIQVGDVTLEGELGFNNGESMVKFDSAPEISIEMMKMYSLFFEELCSVCHEGGIINKIEVVKKP